MFIFHLIACLAGFICSQALRSTWHALAAFLAALLVYRPFQRHGYHGFKHSLWLFCLGQSVGYDYWIYYALRDSIALPVLPAIALCALLFAAIACLLMLPFWLSERLHPITGMPTWAFWHTAFEYARQYGFMALPWLWSGNIWAILPGGWWVIRHVGVFAAGYFYLQMLNYASLSKCSPHKAVVRVQLILCASGLLMAYQCTTVDAPPTPHAYWLQLHQHNLSPQQKKDLVVTQNRYLTPLFHKPHGHNAVHVLPEAILAMQQRDYASLQHQAHFNNSVIGSMIQDDDGHIYQSAIGFNQVHGRYDKMHLVPFGEYIPGIATIPYLQPYVESLVGFSSFTPGSKHTLLTFQSSKLLPLMCYDAFFPLSDPLVSKADRLLVLAENTWYRDSYLQTLLLRAAQLRAMESGKPLALVSNHGPSAFIAAHGAILQQSTTATHSILHQSTLMDGKTFETFWSQYPHLTMLWILVCELSGWLLCVGLRFNPPARSLAPAVKAP